MQEIIKVDIAKLKFDNDINSLVPEMSDEEFSDLVKSIDEEGQRTPIHINKDNTVLDGRHRVRALQELEQDEISAIKENMAKDDALKFVRDTAVSRRNLTPNQKLNITLQARDLIGDIQERAKENQKKSIEVAHSKNPNNQKANRFSSGESNLSSNQHNTPVHENKEIAKLAGVSESTVMRAKKVKNENPEAYEEVIKNNGGWDKAYRELESVKSKKAAKEKEVSKVESQEQTEQPPIKERTAKRDRREEINARAEAVTPEERNMMTSETNAMAIVSISDNLLHLIEDIEDLDLTLQFLKTHNKEDLEKVIKMHKGIAKIIEKGDLQNV
ncbi:ParB N-terminal domain-containing protein [Staphylococcus saprophyticus]|uniref:ParB N-terminal domain-containing protein n=1 Tax=Staphylococcus saprophyticus TaxID=29385 RepID=UPI0019D12C97|nr:ParB N-terminal domain-containing protein [Staphylococcus saprophyticus]MBN6849416.1 ParB N-terminal domain-containing protein [Staphylococcus saprophyticus]MDW4215561.1 ParB N-terminal domain-containing protein [Staphylococcus saprophyticus]